jgi:hypothetical protein
VPVSSSPAAADASVDLIGRQYMQSFPRTDKV